VTVDPEYDAWFGFDCSPAFTYNGTDNLLVETRWDGDNGAGPNCWMRNVPSSARACVASRVRGVPQHGYPDGGAVADYNMYMRITVGGEAVAPTSPGRVKALYR
jgi:hypothetical protein